MILYGFRIIYLMFQMLYMYLLLFFKYHEIRFENVLVKCYVYNKYVFLVSLIYIYIVKMVSWSWRYGYDLGKFCLRRYVLNRTIVTPLVFLRSLPRMYLLGHWVLFIYWQFCFLLCLVIKVFLDSDLLSIEDQELFI